MSSPKIKAKKQLKLQSSKVLRSFLIKNKENQDFKNQIDTIKEGVVLYTGIKFNTNITEVGSWKYDFTIFIDTEILFHYAGYNGELYKSLFNDFYSYVKEVNANNPNRIKLMFFKEVKIEIENFFRTAEDIVEGINSAIIENTAMNTIVNGCKSKSDIVEKKVRESPVDIFKKAVNNVKPVIEVKARRVGGSTYQVPTEVPSSRRVAIGIRWLILHARERAEKTMREKLAAELIDAANNRGGAIKKKEGVHKMAEANKAFAHYRF